MRSVVHRAVVINVIIVENIRLSVRYVKDSINNPVEVIVAV